MAAVEIVGNFDYSEAEEIRRNLEILYGTAEGELVLDRVFGLNLDILDLPIPAAMAKFAAEVITKTQKYEPRAIVEEVKVDPAALAAGIVSAKVVISINV